MSSNKSIYQLIMAAAASMPNVFLTNGSLAERIGLGPKIPRSRVSKYTPHQGDQEKDRRRRQLAAGIIKP